MTAIRTILVGLALHAIAAGAEPAPASYQVTAIDIAGARFAVHATVPSEGNTLLMADSRPGDSPELADAGWPALVKHLKVTDAHGVAVASMNAGAAGWTLEHPVAGPLTLDYEVDFAVLAARGWPAPREAVFADGMHLAAIGRSLFVFTPAQRASAVRFTLPRGWQAVVPWRMAHGVANVATTDDLAENLLAFTRDAPDTIDASGFALKVVAFGKWQPARAEVRRVLGKALPELVKMIGSTVQADYLVVLLPQDEHGGESFRASFALTFEDTPARANIAAWGNTIAHEVFHFWNGWRLRGADYPSTQWFQEGFTEYAANRALYASGLIDAAGFRAKLDAHAVKYGRLTTPLDAPGTHKGPPLYSGGALVAFIWDTRIREASAGRRDLGDMLRTLWQITDGGSRPYGWPDIAAALEATAPGAWEDFHARYISGREQLPLDEALN